MTHRAGFARLGPLVSTTLSDVLITACALCSSRRSAQR